MPLVNVKKKIEKANSDKTGIRPGESVLEACTTNPSGTMKRMLSKELAGVVGSLAASGSSGGAPAGGGLADRFVEGQHFIVLTDQRLLLVKNSALTGKPKELVAEWNLDEVASITVEKGKMADPFTVMFSDGSGVQVEGARGTDPAAVEQGFNNLP